MNEPKKRGRPSKAEIEARISTFPAGPVEGAPRVADEVQVYPDTFERRQAKAYALRVWNGQSSGLPRAVRIDRVRKALESQGMSMEGIEL